jgi:hypothetical protein
MKLGMKVVETLTEFAKHCALSFQPPGFDRWFGRTTETTFMALRGLTD